MSNYIENNDAVYLKKLIKRGGPNTDEYDSLNLFFNRLGDIVRDGFASREQVNQEFWKLLGNIVTPKNMHGNIILKQYGYAGDFEVIDSIYTQAISSDPHLSKWDHYFHSHAAPKAVINRKKYFIEILQNLKNSNSKKPKVLNVGSGSARDLFEFYSTYGENKINCTCIDMDKNAINYSKRLCKTYDECIDFHCKNIFRFHTEETFDLVWSAGLFDYLDDRKFIYLLNHLYRMVNEGGSLVIGNFSTINPSRDYMEAGDWFLFHRTEEELRSFALQSGIEKNHIQIKSEAEKVNLFMHITK